MNNDACEIYAYIKLIDKEIGGQNEIDKTKIL